MAYRLSIAGRQRRTTAVRNTPWHQASAGHRHARSANRIAASAIGTGEAPEAGSDGPDEVRLAPQIITEITPTAPQLIVKALAPVSSTRHAHIIERSTTSCITRADTEPTGHISKRRLARRLPGARYACLRRRV